MAQALDCRTKSVYAARVSQNVGINRVVRHSYISASHGAMPSQGTVLVVDETGSCRGQLFVHFTRQTNEVVSMGTRPLDSSRNSVRYAPIPPSQTLAVMSITVQLTSVHGKSDHHPREGRHLPFPADSQ